MLGLPPAVLRADLSDVAIVPPREKRKRVTYDIGGAVGQHFVGWRGRALGNCLQGVPIVYCERGGIYSRDRLSTRRRRQTAESGYVDSGG